MPNALTELTNLITEMPNPTMEMANPTKKSTYFFWLVSKNKITLK